MENMELLDSKQNKIDYLTFKVDNPKGNIIILHGMAEHPLRYKRLALMLNQSHYNVFILFHLGHGEINKTTLGHFDKDGWQDSIDHIHCLNLKIKEDYLGLPIFLLGHSMGSFIAQDYIVLYSNLISGCILSGSTSPNALIKIGKIIASVIYLFSFNKQKKSKLMDRLSFGSYNKAFKPNRTKFDWLSRDEKEVDLYVNDEYCGFICTIGFYKTFTDNLAKLHQKKKLSKISKELPILLLGGSNDPVSNKGEGVRRLFTIYQHNLKIKDVAIKLYYDARHEVFNEINRNEVTEDLISWLNHHC